MVSTNTTTKKRKRRKKEKKTHITYMYVFSYVSIENYEKKLYIYKVLLKNSPIFE